MFHCRYYMARMGGVDDALVSFHIATKATPEWLWATFEHERDQGLCDTMGCFDSYGASVPAIAPNLDVSNADYGACAKSSELEAMMKPAGFRSGLA